MTRKNHNFRKKHNCSKRRPLLCKTDVDKFGYYKSCRAKKYQNIYGRSDYGIRSPIGLYF